MRIDKIQILDRHRADMGDLTDLAASISAIGLLHPVVVNTDMVLVGGRRRLAAVRSLGWTECPVRIVENLTDAAALLKAERDENTCRKDMTMSELVAVGQRIEELERPKATERQTANLPNGPRVPIGEETYHRTSDVVGPALGMSRRTYDRAKSVVGATQDEDPEVRAIAEEAVKEMDATGKVRPAEDKVRAARKTTEKPKVETTYGEQQTAKWDRVTALAASGSTTRQIARDLGMSEGGVKSGAKQRGIDIRADRVVGRTRRLDSNRIIRECVAELEGVVSGLALVNYNDIDPEEAPTWVDSLTKSMSAISKANRQIKESLQ